MFGGNGFYVQIDATGDWRVNFTSVSHTPVWFDGDVSLEIVMERATEIVKTSKDK